MKMADRFKKIGEVLAAARLEQNKNIKEAAEITKIKASYLEAVEAGDPSQLPSEPYFNLFARSYAQFLGIDPAIFDEFEEVNNHEQTEVSSEYSKDISIKQARSFGRSLLVLVIIVCLIFAAFIIYNQVILKKNSGDSLPAGGGITEREASDRLIFENKMMDPGFNIDYKPYQMPDNLELVMSAKQDVWMVVVRDGDTVLNRQLTAGDVRKWEAKYRFVLTLGISTAVDLTLNGFKLPPLSDRAQTIAGLEINQANYEEYISGEKTIKTIRPAATSQAGAPRNEDANLIPERQPESNIPAPDTLGTDTRGNLNGD